MRFVWIVRDIPMRADTGARIYSNGLIRALLETGAVGSLVCYANDDDKRPDIAGLSVYATPLPLRPRVLSLFSVLQSDAFRLKSVRLAKLIERALRERPDAIFIDYFAMGWALPIVERIKGELGLRSVVVYVSHNYEPDVRRQVADSTKGFMRHVLRLDARKAVRLELELTRRVDLVVANTDEDKESYEYAVPGTSVLTLLPAYDGEILPTRVIDATIPRRVVITGTFDWIAKQAALSHFIDVATAPFRRAGIELVIIGRTPQKLRDELTVAFDICRFTGWVENVQPFLRDARIGIMPDEVGGGFKHKYLYYIFAGLPVATISSQVAGLPLDKHRDMIACDTAAEMVEAIIAAIDDFGKLNEMRLRCWNACAKEFSWADRGRKLRAAIDKILLDANSAA